MKGKYIYGVISTDKKVSFGSCGIADGEEVCAIPYQDISAVVSDSEVVDYTCMVKDAVAGLLVKHQQVIEKIMSMGLSTIPMRLGTFAQDEAEVKDILSKGYDTLVKIMKEISDKIELDVACVWKDFNLVLKEIGQEKAIKEFKEELISNPEGISADDRMKVGVMVKKTLDKKKDVYAQKIQANLKMVSCDLRVHQLMDDKMITNAAFLIDKRDKENFYINLEELNVDFADKINFRCVGPLPPYSFYTLEVKRLEFNKIDGARRKLGLSNDSATKDDIKKAHQARALTFHPDKNPDTVGIEKEFDEVTKAYHLLLDYCQAENCSFKEEDFKKNSLIVRVRQ